MMRRIDPAAPAVDDKDQEIANLKKEIDDLKKA
jgi:hypothetical protein